MDLATAAGGSLTSVSSFCGIATLVAALDRDDSDTLAGRLVPAKIGRTLPLHCTSEMNHLASFLPGTV
jgi:hypothetical protein